MLWGVGYYAAISMWRWYLHVFVGSYVSFGRSPYHRAFIDVRSYWMTLRNGEDTFI